ncbi:MAG: hypothetical protein H7X95_12845, partial [Deltaproteobacteria bacterium]|nr:hypothetical protein [Deltaproteobacteria bacterium]
MEKKMRFSYGREFAVILISLAGGLLPSCKDFGAAAKPDAGGSGGRPGGQLDAAGDQSAPIDSTSLDANGPFFDAILGSGAGGAGGSATGGTSGTGGGATGSGGAVVGTGGVVAGTGGMAPPTGGIGGVAGSSTGTWGLGSGGRSLGTGGTQPGTGGALGTGGAPAATGGRPVSSGGVPGAGGNAGSGGAPGTGGMTLQPPALALAPAAAGTLDFGMINTGSQAKQTFVVSNMGQQASSAVSVTLTGATTFAVLTPSTNDCVSGSTVLNGGASCTVQVRFSPVAVGTTTTMLRVSASTGGTPPTLILTGTGKRPPIGTVTVFSVPNSEFLQG